MTIKRLREFNPLEAQLIRLLYREVKHTAKDGVWRNFKGTFKFRGANYEIECDFKFDGMFLSFKDENKIKIATHGEKSKIIIPHQGASH